MTSMTRVTTTGGVGQVFLSVLFTNLTIVSNVNEKFICCKKSDYMRFVKYRSPITRISLHELCFDN